MPAACFHLHGCVDEMGQLVDAAVAAIKACQKSTGGLIVRKKVVHQLDHLVTLLLTDRTDKADKLVA